MKYQTAATPGPLGHGSITLACAALAATLAATLAGCGSGSSDATVQGDVPLAYVQRVNTIGMNPTNGAPTADGGDLMIREKSSPSAPEINVTKSITQGHGDVSDPEVSYDGKKIVFSLRCATSNTSMVDGAKACTGRWNIWEYDMTKGGVSAGSFKRLTSSTTADDVDPAYLPAGKGFVFTSNRQTTSFNNQGPGPARFALDEYERERVFNLHTMDASGGNITQISVNQSHDRNPVVRPNGDIMFSRWDHVGMRNHFKVFRVKPDGTDMFVLYGAHSEGNSFLHPRDMDPKGKYKGFLTSDLMPLSRTKEGGGLVFVDAANYSEQNTPANPSVAAQGGQYQPTQDMLNIGGGLSKDGRITTPYPLWDGTDRVLLAYRPCEVTRNGKVVPCVTLTDAERARLADDDRLVSEVAADAVKDNVPPPYAIYMFNPADKTMLPVAPPPAGFMNTDPVALQPRPEPNATDPTPVDATLAAQKLGLLEVRSVYDTDGLGRMGEEMIAAADLPAGCTAGIAKTAPTDPLDTRAQVADIVKIKDPANPAYGCTPVRFIRAVRAVAPAQNMMGTRSAIGETDFEPQQILGYAPIEPDGSFKLQVPADTPIGLAVVDAEGRAFQTHTNWIQVRPGERRTCDGCHSPRRGGALNSGAVANTMPAALMQTLAGAHQSGETMAGTRTRLDANLLKLLGDMVSTDVWADTSKAGVTARAPISILYKGNTDPKDDVLGAAPTNGVINYPDHIQPIWSSPRGLNGADTCTGCHSDPTKFDLSGTTAGTGRLASYERLMLGDPLIDEATGLPKTHLEEGVPMIDREPALVEASASEGDVVGIARKSRLMELLSGQTLKVGAEARKIYPAPTGGPDHSKLLTKGEKRLLAEWMDLGGQYYNDLYAGGVKSVGLITQASFEAEIYPILRATCAAGCHQAIGSDEIAAGKAFRENRLVLLGDAEGDFNVTLTMINDACKPESNALLKRPSTIPHPAGAASSPTAVLPVGSANYVTIANWIKKGCSTP